MNEVIETAGQEWRHLGLNPDSISLAIWPQVWQSLYLSAYVFSFLQWLILMGLLKIKWIHICKMLRTVPGLEYILNKHNSYSSHPYYQCFPRPKMTHEWQSHSNDTQQNVDSCPHLWVRMLFVLPLCQQHIGLWEQYLSEHPGGCGVMPNHVCTLWPGWKCLALAVTRLWFLNISVRAKLRDAA